MNWEQIVGSLTIPFNTILAASLFWKGETFFWITVSAIVGWTSLTLVITYFGTEWIKKWVKNQRFLKDAYNRIYALYSQNGFKIRNDKKQKQINNWLVKRKDWIVIVLGFVPFVPWLPTGVIVTTKILGIKNGLMHLLLGNFFRNWIVCFSVYQGFSWFF